MKTSELKEHLTKDGFTYNEYEASFSRSGHIVISMDGVIAATVETEYVNSINTTTHEELVSDKLFNLLTEYARTPIAEREEPKKYRVPIDEMTSCGEQLYLEKSPNGEWDIYIFQENSESFKYVFTEAELADAPSWVQRSWWEEVK